MSITALEIQQVSFGTAKKGYDPAEVDEFLERIAIDVDTLNRAIAEAASRIKAAEERAAAAESALARAAVSTESTSVALIVEEVTQAAPSAAAKEPSVTEDVISKAFIAAQRSADAMQEEARKKAESVYREAEAKARDIVREAYAEKQKATGELERLRESTERFRTDYLSLLGHYSADAQKRFPAFDEVVPPSPAAAYQEQKELFAANDAAQQPVAVASEATKQPVAATATPEIEATATSDAPSSEPEAEPVAVADPFAPSTSTAPAEPAAVQSSAFDEYDDEELDIEEID
jgi:cell division initiation protein